MTRRCPSWQAINGWSQLQRRIIIWTICNVPANLSLELENSFGKIFTITCASVKHLIWKCKTTPSAWKSVNQKSETWFSGSKFEILEWKHFRPGLKCSQTDPTLGTQNNASLSRLIRHLRVSLGAKKFCTVFFRARLKEAASETSNPLFGIWNVKLIARCDLCCFEKWDVRMTMGRDVVGEDASVSVGRIHEIQVRKQMGKLTRNFI